MKTLWLSLAFSLISFFSVANEVELYLPLNDSRGNDIPMFCWYDLEIEEGVSATYDFYFGTDNEPAFF
ncbi:hypothetical protein GM418_12635 [Maribellus comscasis]|uniref:Uncharacterized protein n=1 Tax=Maribellus comscasis TaxID=2681766 RepID=A0A6I6K3G5_9BACT|nr:hypothetical protein [Maribellus comscasis]QGY44474.1 hypothetical protein GM418_12635 [Maribellus comscasis]